MHLEHTNLVGCSKAILDSPQQPVGMIAFALEVEDGISDVLQRLWASNGALFRDMSNDKDGGMGTLCQLHELERAFTYLANAAGR